jgi:nitrite reductase (cytochrome c-552)
VVKDFPENACRHCHESITAAIDRRRTESVEDIQDRFFSLRNTALDALVDLINDIKAAKQNGATDARLATAHDYTAAASS